MRSGKETGALVLKEVEVASTIIIIMEMMKWNYSYLLIKFLLLI